MAPLPINELTELQITESKDSGGHSEIFKINTDPYPDKTPQSILSREYLIYSQTLSVNTNYPFYPFEMLMQDQTIKNYLSLFRFIRAGVQIRILFLTSTNQYGKIAVSSLPYMQDPTAFTTLGQQTQSDMHLLDVAEQTALIMDLPYMSPDLYFDLEQTRGLAPTFLPHYWRVIVHPLVIGTVNLGTPATVQMRVFAHLTDITTAGYMPNPNKVIAFQSAFTRMDWQAASTRIAAAGTAAVGTLGSIAYNRLTETGSKQIENAVKGAVDVGVKKASDLLGDPLQSTNQPEHTEAARNKPAQGMKTKLDVVPDISTLGGHDESSSNVLGDNISNVHSFVPTMRNVFDIQRMCSIPFIVRIDTLSNAGDSFHIPCNPFIDGSHTHYLSKMFKYTRFTTKVHFEVACSAFTRTRLRFTLFPVGTPTYVPEATFGDVITDVISVSGPTSWSMHIPYLQVTPWVGIGDPAVIFPTIEVRLETNIPQPFDKVVSISVITFIAAGDIHFAGLQSFVPEPIAFQSLQGIFDQISPMGSTPLFPYMGGVTSVTQIVNRFSSRQPLLANLYPFPLKFQDTTQMLQFDNFDYIAQLYLFYTGDTNLKMVFSQAPADGVIKVGIQNSNVSLTGVPFKSGNSIAVTHQAVWPVLEYQYPYQNEVEFDSIYAPRAMFNHQVSQGATLAEMLISPANNFAFYYLLPVPTIPAPPPPAQIEFQSVLGRMPGYGDSWFGLLSLGIGNSSVSTSLGFNSEPGVLYDIVLSAAVTRVSGATDDPFIVNVGDTSPAIIPNLGSAIPGSLISLPLIWRDVTNTGDNVFYNTVHSVSCLDTAVHIECAIMSVAAVLSAYDFYISITVRPISAVCALADNGFLSQTIAKLPLEIDIVSSQTTLDTTVTNTVSVSSATELEVTVTNSSPILTTFTNTNIGVDILSSVPLSSTIVSPIPLPISFTENLDVNVISSVPIEIVVSPPIPVVISGPDPLPVTLGVDPLVVEGRVQGVVAPDTPVFMTQYFAV